ncbi:MAG: hypothetical protein ACJA09_004082 [Alcanivorax sp.]|jgi:hypothetical protein
MISIASLFLVQNIGLSEIASGYAITAYGTLVTITLFGAGFFTAVIRIGVTMWFMGRDNSTDEIDDDEGVEHELSTSTEAKTTIDFIFSIIREPVFKRMLILMAALLGVRAVFL